MLRTLAYIGLIGGTLVIAPAFAQTTGASTPANAPAATPAPSSTAADTSAPENNEMFVRQQKAGQWRAPKLIGVSVVGPGDEKVGKIEDVILDRSGRVDAVVIGVGGFLGIGTKDIGVPFGALHWETEARRANVPPAAQPIGSPAPAPETAPRAMDPALIEASQGYPDKARIDLTRDQLKAAPDFKYVSTSVAQLEATQSPGTAPPAAAKP